MQPMLAPKAVFDQAIALINSGDLGGAEARCHAALAEYPRDVNMLALLGALLIKLDRAEEAEAKLRQAITEAPTFAKPCTRRSDYPEANPPNSLSPCFTKLPIAWSPASQSSCRRLEPSRSASRLSGSVAIRRRAKKCLFFRGAFSSSSQATS